MFILFSKLLVSIDFSAFASVCNFFYRDTAYRMELGLYRLRQCITSPNGSPKQLGSEIAVMTRLDTKKDCKFELEVTVPI